MKNKGIIVFIMVIGTLLCTGFAFADNVSTSVTVSNAGPVVSSVVLNGGSDINLNAGVNTVINGTFTITDSNGCDDILTVTGVLHHSSFLYSDSDDLVISGTCNDNSDCSGGADIDITYNCSFDVPFYANATSSDGNNWTFTARAEDSQAVAGFGYAYQEVNTLIALDLDVTTLTFQPLAPGENTSTNSSYTVDVSNQGNVLLDFNLSSYGVTEGDGYAMNCTTGTIADNYLHYEESGVFANYDASSSVVSTGSSLDINLSAGPISSRIMYFGLGIPYGIAGTCNGTIIITGIDST